MPVDAHLAGADAARRVADEPAVVVGGRFGADGVFELDDDGEGGESAAARGGGADDASRGDLVDRGGEAFEDEGVVAEAAAEREACGVLESDGVRDLAFEREDFLGLVGGGSGRANGVFAGVETQAFCQLLRVGFGNRGAKTFNRWEYLLVEIPLYVWF